MLGNSLFTLQMNFIKHHPEIELDVGITKDSYIFDMKHRKVPVCQKFILTEKHLAEMGTNYAAVIESTWQNMYIDILKNVGKYQGGERSD